MPYRLEDLEIPQPPYRMSRPVAQFAADVYKDMGVVVHETPPPKQTEEIEIERFENEGGAIAQINSVVEDFKDKVKVEHPRDTSSDTVEVKPGTPEGDEVAAARAAAEAVLKARENPLAGLEPERTPEQKAEDNRIAEELRRRQIEKPQQPTVENFDIELDENMPEAPAFDESDKKVEETPTQAMEEKMTAVNNAKTAEERRAALDDMQKAYAEFQVAAEAGRADRAASTTDRMDELRRDIERGSGNKLFDTVSQKRELTELLGQNIAELTLKLDRNANNPLESARIKDDIEKLKYERSELARPPTWFGQLKQKIAEGYEKADKKLSGSFVGQRLKGLLTAGIAEGLQAETIRTGTAAMGESLEASPADIMSEAQLDRLVKSGVILPESIKWARAENDKQIDKYIGKAMAIYDEKMSKARTMKGEGAQEKRAQVAVAIREALMKRQEGTSDKQIQDYTKIIRKTFSPTWWTRYGLAAFDAALVGVAASAGIKYLTAKYLTSSSAAAPLKAAGAETVPKKMMLHLKKNIWTDLKNLALKNGHKATNADLLKATKQFVADNNVNYIARGLHGTPGLYEPAWSSIGDISTHSLPPGWIGIISPAVRAILNI